MKKLKRLFAALCIAGLLFVFPAITGTENVAEAGLCDGRMHTFVVKQPEGTAGCGEGQTQLCFYVVMPDCTSMIICGCL